MNTGKNKTGKKKIIRSSHKVLNVTSNDFETLRKDINSIYETKISLQKDLEKLEKKYNFKIFLNIVTFTLISTIKQSKKLLKTQIEHLQKDIDNTFVDLKFSDNSQFEKRWLNCIDSFSEIMKSDKIWDLVYSEDINSAQERTIAKNSIDRKEIKEKDVQPLPFIKSDVDYLYLPNLNGPNIYIFPTFLIIFKDYTKFGIFDLKEINFDLTFTQFIETEKVPKDSEIIDHTWAKTNKNGSPDKRYKENYQIPIVRYGQFFIESETGLNEGYMFSNPDVFSEFINSMENHINNIK